MTTLTTPVAFIIFNRPDKTARVFEEIRKAKPRQLFIIADGPRTPKEKERTDAARAVTEHIDWECVVLRKYEEKNLGVKYAPPAGISWVFEHVDRAIFLEDDCLPSQSFFYFCEEMLEKYKDDERIVHISGDTYVPYAQGSTLPESYHFSNIVYLWGWATWRRAWKYHDTSMSRWPEALQKDLLLKPLPNFAVREHWKFMLAQYYLGDVNSWDGPWVLACLLHGVCINPSVNLISNIGADEDAAHEAKQGDKNPGQPLYELHFPLIHPLSVSVDKAIDAYEYVHVFYINKYIRDKIRTFIKEYWPSGYTLGQQVFRFFLPRH